MINKDICHYRIWNAFHTTAPLQVHTDILILCPSTWMTQFDGKTYQRLFKEKSKPLWKIKWIQVYLPWISAAVFHLKEEECFIWYSFVELTLRLLSVCVSYCYHIPFYFTKWKAKSQSDNSWCWWVNFTWRHLKIYRWIHRWMNQSSFCMNYTENLSSGFIYS